MERRVKTKEVRAAYAKTGCKPARGTWNEECGEPNCALGVIRAAAKTTLDVNDYVTNRYGKGYVEGFTQGFDGVGKVKLLNNMNDKFEQNTPEWKRALQGYVDGRRVARSFGYKVPALKKAN